MIQSFVFFVKILCDQPRACRGVWLMDLDFFYSPFFIIRIIVLSNGEFNLLKVRKALNIFINNLTST
jgi:hypothetical protein